MQGYVVVDTPSVSIGGSSAAIWVTTRSDIRGGSDDLGKARFEALCSSEAPGVPHTVQAYAPVLPLPAIDATGRPLPAMEAAGLSLLPIKANDRRLPTEEELVGRVAMSAGTVTVQHDQESRIDLRLQRVGYVRGVIRTSSIAKSRHYCVGVTADAPMPISGFVVDGDDCEAGGEFVLGPFAEGRATVWAVAADVNRKTVESRPTNDEVAFERVEIRSDRVAHVELVPKKRVAQVPRVTAQTFRGQVYMVDGKTPACGASLAIVVPNTSLSRYGTTDALGRVWVTGVVDFFAEANVELSRAAAPWGTTHLSPIAVDLIAWFPGTAGATISRISESDLNQPLKVVLPPPLAIHGKVTVGGKSILGRESQFHVLAAYEGPSPLKEVSARRVSAEADGSFELPALTPGTYRIQAAMDDIWLSPGVRLNVGAGPTPPHNLALDIGEPGPPSVIRVVDKQGQPVPGVEATVVRPEGALAETLWPPHFESDGAGVINIPPLEAGTHRVKIRGADKEYSLVVPPLSKANVTPAGPPVVVEQK